MSAWRRVRAVLGLTAAVAVGSLALGASPASAQSLPSNCWWSNGNLENLFGVAGYCSDGNGNLEWFDWNGGYGNAWWMYGI